MAATLGTTGKAEEERGGKLPLNESLPAAGQVTRRRGGDRLNEGLLPSAAVGRHCALANHQAHFRTTQQGCGELD